MDCYYSGKDKLLGWIDNSWNELLYDGRFMSKYVFLLAGGSVLWSSKKQDIVATSIMVAEYYAQYYKTTELF